MKKQDRKQFIIEMAKLGEAVGDSPTEGRIMVYFEDLMDFPIEVVINSIREARKTTKWFPKIPELREICIEKASLWNTKDRIGPDHQLPERIRLTPEEIEKTNKRIRELIAECEKKLGIEPQGVVDEARSERMELLRNQAELLRGK